MGTATQPALLEAPESVADTPEAQPVDDPFAAAAAALRTTRRPTRTGRSPRATTTPAAALPLDTAPAPMDVPDPAVPRTAGDPAGRLAAAVAAIIAPLGVPEVDQRDRVIAAVAEFLDARGIDADVTSLRYGVLTLATDPAHVEFVRCDTAEISDVCSTAGFVVRDVRVRSRRR